MHNQQTSYEREERLDDYLRRQSETRRELADWSKTDDFRWQIKEIIIKDVLKDQDELANLSKRLFETGMFVNLFKILTSEQLDNSRKEGLWKACRHGLSLLIGGIIGALIIRWVS